MHPATLSVLAVLALGLAGCTTPAQPATDASAATTPRSAAPAAPEALALEGIAAAPQALFLQPDSTLADAPPASEGALAPTVAVNSPMATDADFPTWTGTLAAAAVVGPGAGVPYTFYFTTSSANLEANAIPLFKDADGFQVTLQVGNLTLQDRLDGPPVMHTGQTYQASGTFQPDAGQAFAAGEAVSFHVVVIYAHITKAAEFQFLMGPEHPSGFVLGGPA